MSRVPRLTPRPPERCPSSNVSRPSGERRVMVRGSGGVAPCPNPVRSRGSCGPSRPQTSGRNVSSSSRQVSRLEPSEENVEAPSQLQKQVFRQALSKSAQQPKKVVRSMGSSLSEIRRPVVQTKRGKEPVIQQLKYQKTVQRTPKAEYVAKTCIGVDVGPTGVARQLEITSQQIDPTHATESAGVNETVATTSSLSITARGKQIKKSVKRKTVTAKKLAGSLNLNPQHINRLVKEEADDVDTTLKMVPPDLVSTSLDKYPLKRKLQNLRLTSEPVNILTESIIHPAPTADEVEAEAPPEVLASVMDAVERGATPASAPNQIFNSLFPEVEEPRIDISAVAPGPLEDLVVPTAQPPRLVEEVLTHELEEFLVAEIQNKTEVPKDDICAEKNITPATYSPKEVPPVPMLLDAELPPWEDSTVQKLSSIVGADPIDLWDPSDFSVLQSPEEISQELSKGIDYFIDADVVPFETKIQIRGSKPPKWFPGYMSALSDLPGLVEISRCPCQVLHKAWKAVQPKVFPEESLLIM